MDLGLRGKTALITGGASGIGLGIAQVLANDRPSPGRHRYHRFYRALYGLLSEALYRLSKVGLHSYMQNLALEMAPDGIRVNMVTPGHFKTRMTGNIPAAVEDQLRGLIPAHRFGQPVEVGSAVALLLADRVSGYTYGADLVIDGGLSLQPLPLFAADEIYNLNLPASHENE